MIKMRKRLTILLLALCSLAAVVPISAGTGEMNYKMDYDIHRRLFLNGNQVTLLTTNLEWPQFIAGSDIPALQKHLSRLFFDSEVKGLEDLLSNYTKTLGTEIKAMPEGPGYQIQYVYLYLQFIGGEKGKYVSFYTLVLKRQGDKTEPDFREQTLFTYDIVGDKVLTVNDILVFTVFPNLNDHYYLLDLIFENDRRIKDYNILEGLPDQVCLLPQGVVFNFKGTAEPDGFDRLTMVPMRYMKDLMKRAAKKLIDDKSKAAKDKGIPPKPLKVPKENDDSCAIYDLVEEMPEFVGGMDALAEYLTRMVNYPEVEQQLGQQGRVVVAFVIERDGSVSQPSVISSVSPILDREAVEAVMSMPKWNPGKDGGKPVRTRVVVPVNYKLK